MRFRKWVRNMAWDDSNGWGKDLGRGSARAGAHAGNTKREAEYGYKWSRRETEWTPAASGCGQISWGKALGKGKWPAMPTHENAR